jgi:hypothetical protein
LRWCSICYIGCGVKKLDSVGTAVLMIAAEPVQTEASC